MTVKKTIPNKLIINVKIVSIHVFIYQRTYITIKY